MSEPAQNERPAEIIADNIEGAIGNPVETFQAISNGLGIDVGSQLGLPFDNGQEECETYASEHSEEIKKLGHFIKFLAERSLIEPVELGKWLMRPNPHIMYAEKEVSPFRAAWLDILGADNEGMKGRRRALGWAGSDGVIKYKSFD